MFRSFQLSRWLHAHRTWFLLRLQDHRRTRLLESLGWNAAVPMSEELPAPLADLNRQEQGISEALERSLEEDRRDYAVASSWGRWLVVLRGAFGRAFLRQHRGLLRKRARPLLVEFGTEVVRGTRTVANEHRSLVLQARKVDAHWTDLRQQHGEALHAFGGKLYPRPVEAAARELIELGRAVAGEFGARTIPRLPALIGLVAGYWVTRSFTTSRWSGFLNQFGLYHGEARIVDAETYQRLQFWLPLLAAATCSYLGARVSRLVRAKYARGEENPLRRPKALQ